VHAKEKLLMVSLNKAQVKEGPFSQLFSTIKGSKKIKSLRGTNV